MDLAAKVLKPTRTYDELAASALAELQKLVHLRHPHITYVYDAFELGRRREMALALAPPLSFALEKALRRHVTFRTETAEELWRDLHSPPGLESETDKLST